MPAGSSKAVWAACRPASPAALLRCSRGTLKGGGARAGVRFATCLSFLPRSPPEPRLLPAEDEREKEAALAALPPGYFSPEFDPVSAELGRLRPAFSEAELEAVVEGRAAALEVVTERLSAHVLARYDSFITGVDEARRP